MEPLKERLHTQAIEGTFTGTLIAHPTLEVQPSFAKTRCWGHSPQIAHACMHACMHACKRLKVGGVGFRL